MSQVNIIVNSNDNKVKIDWLYIMKIVLGTIREDQFLNIILEVDYKYLSYCYNVSLLILRFLSLKISLLFYTIFPFHLYPPHADQIVGIDSCPISTFLKSLGSSYKAENYCSGITSSLMQPESQLQSIQCGGSSFPLNISQLSFVLFLPDTYPHPWNGPEHCS